MVAGRIACVILALLLLGSEALALDAPAPVNRSILALYDGSATPNARQTPIHEYAEMPLNYLGFTVTYWDLQRGLPDPATTRNYAAILTWFQAPLKDASSYLEWAAASAQAGVRLIILGDPDVSVSEELQPSLQAVFRHLGLQLADRYVGATYRARVLVKNPEVVEFERTLDPILPGYQVIQEAPSATGLKSDLEVQLDNDATTRSILVATGPGGGYAAEGYILYFEPTLNRVQWILNPFAFFRAALGHRTFPVPDVTTLNGRRIYFSHIDGDGWNSLSLIEKYEATQPSCAEVVRQELIEPYPDLPVTVGLVAGDTNPLLGGMDQARQSAKAIFALPQVELGSHTCTHPYQWGFFETYDRSKEEQLLTKVETPPPSIRERLLDSVNRLPPSIKHRRYISGSDDLPRSYLRFPFSLDQEIAGALKVTNLLAPSDKRVKLYQWSGDTTPFEAAVRKTREAGIRNMNGGDSRLDLEFPSVAYVPPISVPVGSERQIYAVNSNENTYTNDWTGPYFGFMNLSHTLAATEFPRRLKPANVYYHMYSGERPSSVQAVKNHLEWARHAHVIPIPASQYAAIAEGFFSTRIVELAPNRWMILNRGDLQTVRFDDAQGVMLDLASSSGAIGQTRPQDGLYVALDPAVEKPIVALQTVGTEPTLASQPYLEESRWQISDLERTSCGFKFRTWGFGHGDIRWKGLEARPYRISARHEGEPVWDVTVSPQNGNMSISIPATEYAPIDVTFACNDATQ